MSTVVERACEWLVDNAVAYDRVMHAIDSARHSVRIMQLAFDGDCIGYDEDGIARTITSCLISAARDRGVHVDILLNATILLDTAKPLRRFFADAGASTIRVRGITRFPQLLHAKVIIVDDVHAFLIGSPFANGYWDDNTHAPSDPRRPLRELAGRPVHDLSVRLSGACVADLRRQFAALWAVSTGSGTAPLLARAEHAESFDNDAPGQPRVVTTLPSGLVAALPNGSTEIIDAVLDGIGSARRSIYIEHQYMSARPVVSALARALTRNPLLEVIVVMNQNPDVTAYRVWQLHRLRDAGMLAHPRIGLFTLWSSAHCSGRVALNQIFVHSKVLIVDHDWMIAGSANLDGVSLFSYGDDFEGWAGRRMFSGVRNIDTCVVLDGRRGDQATLDSICDLRSQLWTEHGGFASVADARADGWLDEPGALTRWRAAAADAVRALDSGRTAPTRFLPYSTQATPLKQLNDVGVSNTGALDLQFNPGWLEVHCSPNWIRNMFA